MNQALCRDFDSPLVSRRKASSDTCRKLVDWAVWNCQVEEYTNEYDRTVSYYVKEGKAILSFNSGEILDVESGDLVTIEEETVVCWNVIEPISAHYCYHNSYESAGSRLKQVYWNN